MIVIGLIILTILVLLGILNYKNNDDGNVELFDNVSTDMLKHQMNEITALETKFSSKDDNNNLYYYPYNDLYKEYKTALNTELCKKKTELDYRNNKYASKMEILNDQYTDLRRKISPAFNTVLGDIVRINKYEQSDNDKVNFLTVKRHNVSNNKSNNNNDKYAFQVYLTKDGKKGKCLEQSGNGLYKVSNCINDINNASLEKQLFNIEYVYDKSSYENIVKEPSHRFPENAKLINYPVTLIRGDNGNCINLYKDNISMEPCKYKKSQMFKLNPI